jgi:hypothetical protein
VLVHAAISPLVMAGDFNCAVRESLMSSSGQRATLFLITFCSIAVSLSAQPSLEQRQPLELVFVDSIVPQDRHEMMSTTGAWHARDGATRNVALTQKVEWGLSDQLQIATFVPFGPART